MIDDRKLIPHMQYATREYMDKASWNCAISLEGKRYGHVLYTRYEKTDKGFSYS